MSISLTTLALIVAAFILYLKFGRGKASSSKSESGLGALFGGWSTPSPPESEEDETDDDETDETETEDETYECEECGEERCDEDLIQFEGIDTVICKNCIDKNYPREEKIVEKKVYISEDSEVKKKFTEEDFM